MYRKLLKNNALSAISVPIAGFYPAGIGLASTRLGVLRLVGGVVRILSVSRPVLWGIMALALVLPALSTSGQAQEETTRKVKARVDPMYPELARKMHISGTVKLQIVISKDGNVKSTKVIGGPPLLIDASVDAVKRWKFEEAKDETTQPVEFKYNN
jgi:TonB family protein